MREVEEEKKESFATLIYQVVFWTSGVITSCRSVCLINLFIRVTDRSTMRINMVDDKDRD